MSVGLRSAGRDIFSTVGCVLSLRTRRRPSPTQTHMVKKGLAEHDGGRINVQNYRPGLNKLFPVSDLIRFRGMTRSSSARIWSRRRSVAAIKAKFKSFAVLKTSDLHFSKSADARAAFLSAVSSAFSSNMSCPKYILIRNGSMIVSKQQDISCSRMMAFPRFGSQRLPIDAGEDGSGRK